MKNWIIMGMALLPIILEIIYDHWCWRNGKDDKPGSTWLRAQVFIMLAIVAALLMPWPFVLSALWAGLFFWATHWLLFNPMLNWSRPFKTIGYRKKGEWFYNKPYYMEYFFKGWAWYVAWLLVFKWNYVTDHTLGTWQGSFWSSIKQFITF